MEQTQTYRGLWIGLLALLGVGLLGLVLWSRGPVVGPQITTLSNGTSYESA